MKTVFRKLRSDPSVKAYQFFGCFLLFFMFSLRAYPAGLRYSPTKKTDISEEIRRQLNKGNLWLNYPVSAKRFYDERNYLEQWITPDNQEKTWKAMLMLDCVLQFGLSYSDYHFSDHLPSALHDILERPDQVTLAQKARFEIMLTDDMITFVNQLHFGVLNPSFAQGVIDSTYTGFRSEVILANAMKQEKFMAALTAVQPKSRVYERLQEYLSSSVRYLDNCYQLPEGELQNVAMNMERLRWAAIEEKSYILVNIPSYTLKYYHADNVDEFKVTVGRPETPTPSLQSKIESFTTGPDRKVPRDIFIKQILPNAVSNIKYLEDNHYTIYNQSGEYVNADRQTLASLKHNPSGYYARQSAGCDNGSGSIVFSFHNLYEISMHDTPDKSLFHPTERALGQGGISVENAVGLAALMLKNDDAAAKVKDMQEADALYSKQTFILKRAIPFKIVYLTCDVLNEKLVTYNDIYNLDKSLQLVMFPPDRPISMR